MSRRNAQLQAIDVSTWPTVAYTQFDDTTRHMFEKRVHAVMAYVQGESVNRLSTRQELIVASCTAGSNGLGQFIRTGASSAFVLSFAMRARQTTFACAPFPTTLSRVGRRVRSHSFCSAVLRCRTGCTSRSGNARCGSRR